MLQPDLGPLQDFLEWEVVPWIMGKSVRFRSIDDSPVVVVVSVWVECDLLFWESAQLVPAARIAYASIRLGRRGDASVDILLECLHVGSIQWIRIRRLMMSFGHLDTVRPSSPA